MKKSNILIVYPTLSLTTKHTGAYHARERDKLLADKQNLFVLQPFTHEKDKIVKINQAGTCFFKQIKIFNKEITTFLDFYPPLIMKIRSIVKKEKIDLIIVNYLYGTIASKLFTDVPVIYESLNMEGEIAKYFYPIKIRIIDHLIQKYIWLIEFISCKCANYIFTVSEDDKNLMTRHYRLPEEKIGVAQYGIKTADIYKVADNREYKIANNWDPDKIHLIFHGSLPHPPNERAMKLIKENIALKLLKFNPLIEFKIAGTNLIPEEGKNIEFLGFVDDLESFLRAADIAIVPIDTGSGVRVKMFDYLKRGIPIITTKFAMRGFSVKNQVHVLMSENIDDKFINNIKKLVNSRELREEIGKNAIKLLKDQHNWGILAEQYNKQVENIINKNR